MKSVMELDCSHEEYFIYMAKAEQKHDIFAAKSWLIVAQTLYPQNFGILFQIYKLAKQEKSIADASRCLSLMFQNFQHESSFWNEVGAIMELLCEPESQNVSQSFLTQIFYSLSEDIQKGLIKFAAEKSKDTISYCSLMLLLITTFPETTAYNGLKLVDALVKAESANQSPLNPFRRKLVCELLPRLLQAEGFEVRPKTLHQLLVKSIEFYVAYATTPLKVAQASLERDDVIEDLWQELFDIVRLIGWNLGWELASEFDNICNRELILQKIQTMVESGARLGGPKGDSGDVREVLFTTTAIFLHALLDYTQRLHPTTSPNDYTQRLHPHHLSQGDISGSSSPPLTLVEAFTVSERREGPFPSRPLLSPTSKRLRPSLEEEPVTAFITVSKLSETLTHLSGVCPSPPHTSLSLQSTASSQALITAIKCWDLLHAYDTIKNEFLNILEGLNVESCLVVFNLDVLIYEGRLEEAERQLRHALSRARQIPPSPNSYISTIALNLKLASVLYSLNKFSAATESALEIVEQITPLSTQGGLTNNLVVPTTSFRRHLHLLALTRSQCLQFITTLLIHSLHHLLIEEGSRDDLCIGHLLVLLQYEWPRYDNILEEIVKVVRKKEGFAYQYFAPYVTTPDILEEFMYLATSHGGGFQLDILPLPHSSKQQRMSTRGADRGSKQDFKIAMNKQMLRCHESVEANILAFLQRQGPYISHVFM